MFREVKHPILVSALSKIRDVTTPRDKVLELVRTTAEFLTYEALKNLKPIKREIDTWIGKREFPFVREEEVVFVPILRAGVAMLEGALRVVPNASSGFIAMMRDEKTLEPRVFYSRLPDIESKIVLILDPMLATGGTLIHSLKGVSQHNPSQVISLHLVCAPEGIKVLKEEFPQHNAFTISIDEGLNQKGFIIPGLGDMGDRLYS